MHNSDLDIIDGIEKYYAINQELNLFHMCKVRETIGVWLMTPMCGNRINHALPNFMTPMCVVSVIDLTIN